MENIKKLELPIIILLLILAVKAFSCFRPNNFIVQGQGNPVPSKYAEIEEMTGWSKNCQVFTEGYPQTTCNENMTNFDSQLKKSGNYSLRLEGSKTIRNSYKIKLPIKPNTKYKIGAWLKIANRRCYNYLGLNYPSFFSTLTPGVVSLVQNTKGVWCGRYFLRSSTPDNPRSSDLLQPIIIDYPYISNSETDWFYEDGFIQSAPSTTELTLSLDLEGFDGQLFVDSLTLEEVDSFIDDKYLHIPIEYEFAGMKIKTVSPDPLFVETNAGKFIFSNNQIQFQKGEETLSTITFAQDNFLQNLQTTRENGLVILENTNVVFSLGADSSMLTKLKNHSTLTIEGNKPGYHSFEAGIIFATDYNKGILFSPIYSTQMLRSLPYHYDSNSVNYSYNDTDFQSLGIKNWQVLSDFSQNIWKVSYNFKKGDGFVAALFPPKDFNEMKYCKERMSTGYVNINLFPNSDYSDNVKIFSERFKINLIWMSEYDVSVNNLDPPTQYYQNGQGQPVSSSNPGAVAVPFTPVDVAGPFTVKEKAAFHRFIEEYHRNGLKVIVYMSPDFFYTSNPDVLLDNLDQNLKEFDLDGVYFDGLYQQLPLKALELVRKTRNKLKDKFYAQHTSWTYSLIFLSDHFRVPFLDAYADRLWVGEGIKKVDDATWRLNYCGQNVSNTVSNLDPELRPVNYNSTAEESKALSLSPEQQIDKQLACRGEFLIYGGEQSLLRDPHFGSPISYNSSYYLDKLNNYCLAITCGDKTCDVGETVNNCPNDCNSASVPGDVNGDGHVNIADYSIFVSKYGTNDSSCDFNKNGVVDMGDYAVLVANYGK